ncbi:MAG: hypothetical protein M3345_06165 [Actinomycetota bacterium]|nr:hypothetical protein [Actinomycetota bacterium]
MKRSMILFMVLGLIAGSVATAEAEKRKKPARVERTVEGSYGFFPFPAGCNDPLGPWACLIVDSRRTERFFTAKVTDTHDQPIFVEVRSFPGGRVVAAFCGETTEPIAFPRGSSLEFEIGVSRSLNVVGPDCPANRVKTIGTISVTLSNVP